MIPLSHRVLIMSAQGVDIEMMTMVFRSEGFSDTEIAAAYDTAAESTTTEVVRGQFYIREKSV